MSWLDLAPCAAHRRLQPGQALFRQGDAAAAVYLLEMGRISLTRCLTDGSTVALHTARPGETFAEAALFSPTYHCDAVAEVASRVAVLPKDRLLATLVADADAGLALARLLAGQVRSLRTRLELRNIRSAPERLLSWLALQAEGDPPVVQLDRPWLQIAQEIGLTPEAVYRATAALQRNGRIRRSSTMVELLPRT